MLLQPDINMGLYVFRFIIQFSVYSVFQGSDAAEAGWYCIPIIKIIQRDGNSPHKVIHLETVNIYMITTA